jgi:hypothetical protein
MCVLCIILRQIDVNTGQVKQPGEPGNYKQDVEGFNPKHIG